MSIDGLIVNPGRLRILAALASEPRQEFVKLRGVTQMTDGNLTTHARRLRAAGLLAIDKTFRDGKPVTTITLTPQGRTALESHVRTLMISLQPAAAPEPVASPTPLPEYEESAWID
jgi:DNA-binding MarR family transcriptional regulator